MGHILHTHTHTHTHTRLNDRRFVTSHLCHKSLISQSVDDMSQKKVVTNHPILHKIMTNGPYILVHTAPIL